MFTDWSKVIELIVGPLLGTLIGGGITIASLYFKEYFDRRREVQSWFEREYVIEGIDPLLNYLELALINLRMKHTLGPEFGFVQNQLSQPPSEALIKVRHLIRHGSFSGSLMAIVVSIESALKNPLSQGKTKELERHIDDLCIYLSMLGNELMQLRLRKKADVYSLAKNNKTISLALKVMREDHEKTLSEITGKMNPTSEQLEDSQTQEGVSAK